MPRSPAYLHALLAAALPLGLPRDSVRAGEDRPAATQETPAFQRQDFTVKVGDRELVATLVSPPDDKLAAQPALLLTFSADRQIALFTEPYSWTPMAFVQHGHRALSFDLPCHGERVGQFGSGVAGFCASFVAGVDPFKMGVEDGQAVIGECIRRGWATPGRIAVEGASRAGYAALRLLAAEPRIAVGAGLAPVTDWRLLSEFAGARDRADVADLQLTHFVGAMAGRHVYAAIGKNDERVGTSACQDFCRALETAQVAAGCAASYVELHLTDDPGHSVNSGYPRSIEFLLRWATAR
jgi:hypothetical protein